MADLGNIASFAYSVPEIVLALSVVALFIVDLVVVNKQVVGRLALVAIGVVVAMLAFSMPEAGDIHSLFHRQVVYDEYGQFFKMLLALCGFAAVWMSLGSVEVRRVNQGEYFAILLAATLGMLFMASATNLLMGYLALEFVSLASYVLCGYALHSRRASEASLKYLIYGGVASGTMIYGMSWIYGLTGSLDFATIQNTLAASDGSSLPLFVGLVLTLAGFGYKVSAFPFHMWAPDIYQGAPIPVATFLAVGSKSAGFALMIRFFFTAVAIPSGGGVYELVGGVDWTNLLLAISIVTMTFGNLAAMNQTKSVKRLLAYSSVAHAGYLLMGLVVLTGDGLSAMLFYLAIYYIMNLGAFLVVMIVANQSGRDDLDSFRGLAWRGGILPATAMAIFLFSLTGLPPFAGFIGKFYLFAAVIQRELYFLAIAGVLNSVLSLFYYVKIVRTMFLVEPEGGEGPVVLDRHNGVLLGVLAVATLVLGVYWAPLADLADRSAHFFIG
ncbi:MAG TPA: NADH-quinone oxidoreductase subunit N [Deltaproteobacteria bacterium]|nr:NADH-quinone oxidoreductase subunit N [Deltaproteobacteria bacterium]